VRKRIRKYAPLLLPAMLMLCLAGLTSCAPKTVYVRGDSETVQIKAGEPAPHDGWLLTNPAMIDLLECCGNQVE